jgi:hypothetical protein
VGALGVGALKELETSQYDLASQNRSASRIQGQRNSTSDRGEGALAAIERVAAETL